MNFESLKRFYSENFSLGYLNPISDDKFSSFERKLVLISLICYVYEKNKPKNPDLTYFSLLCKINNSLNLPEQFIKGLAIVCEDFGYHCHEFPTFGLEGKDILKEIKNILNTYIPF